MPRKVKSARGEVIDFDLLKIKQQIASRPPTTDVKKREDFIDKKLRRRVKRIKKDITTEEETVVKQETTEKTSQTNEESKAQVIKSSQTSTQTTSENIINLNNDLKEETVVYESKNEKINKNLILGFSVFLIGLIFLLIRK